MHDRNKCTLNMICIHMYDISTVKPTVNYVPITLQQHDYNHY